MCWRPSWAGRKIGGTLKCLPDFLPSATVGDGRSDAEVQTNVRNAEAKDTEMTEEEAEAEEGEAEKDTDDEVQVGELDADMLNNSSDAGSAKASSTPRMFAELDMKNVFTRGKDKGSHGGEQRGNSSLCINVADTLKAKVTKVTDLQAKLAVQSGLICNPKIKRAEARGHIVEHRAEDQGDAGHGDVGTAAAITCSGGSG